MTIAEIGAELEGDPSLIAAFDLDRDVLLEALGGQRQWGYAPQSKRPVYVFPVEDGDTDE